MKKIILLFFVIFISLNAKCNLKDKAWSSNSSNCKKGFLHGEAVAYHANGKLKFDGIFENGSMKSGMVYFANKPFYTGNIVNNEMHGKGICFFKDKPETCEYYKGDRVDAIYKLRFLMRQQLLVMKAMANEMQQYSNYQNTNSYAPVPAQDNGVGSQIGDRIIDKATDKAVDMILDSFF